MKRPPRQIQEMSCSLREKKYNIERARVLIRNFLLVKILIAQQVLSPWSCGICSRPLRMQKKVLGNFRVVASVLYDLMAGIDDKLPTVQQIVQKSSSFKASLSSHFTAEEESDSFVQSLMSWLLRSDTDDSVAGHELILLQDHPVFEKLEDIGSFLFSKRLFSDAQASIDTWLVPLRGELERWIDSVIRYVIEVKFEVIQIGDEASTNIQPRISLNNNMSEV